tara:strand:+ start:125 stop:436 length:312 start_codon:yes stop_codon:yes gene_type:complete
MKTSLLTISMTGITSNQINNFDLLIIYTMLICCLMPMISIARSNEILSQIAASSSFGCKIAILIISYAVFIGDWSIGSIGTTILIVGDAGLIALTLLYGTNKY